MKVLLQIIMIAVLANCALKTTKVQVDETFYKDCMETVQNKEKCDALVQKSELREKEKEEKIQKLTEEQLNGLEIRDKFKDRMAGKTKRAVISSIGEPDERNSDATGRDYFIYRKPLTRYSVEHDPDLEIIIVFKREFVTKVLHTPPPSTSKNFLPFLGDKPKKTN